MAAPSIWRYSGRDGVLVALAIAHGAILLGAPPMPVVAVGLWWGANTISHNFIHLPFFRSRGANSAFSTYLTLVLGMPQSLWRARHLAHHADDAIADRARLRRIPWTRTMSVECGVIAALWLTLGTLATAYFWTAYLPGVALGLSLCFLQGHYEHVRGTTSHYGRLYNLLFFNDGYHVEHHTRPTTHWTHLPAQARIDPRSSAWPPVLRWLEPLTVWRHPLDGLEVLVLRAAWLQRLVLGAHRTALRRALHDAGDIRRVTVVGGGLFPRTALIMRELLPSATITIVDADKTHIDRARPLLGDDIRTEHRTFRDADGALDADLVVIPLAYLGDRESIYHHPPARVLVVHDWIWRPRGRSVRVSALLLKRLNVIVSPTV
ncbi:MAG: fatty acid desaturase [Acidobacteriota bacterium]